jgi:signal transduction histidine kinase
MNLEVFNVPEVIMKVVEANKPSADKKDIQMNVSISPNVSDILSDKLRFQQILINLVNNAIKFTDVGLVSIECHKENDFIIVLVKDTGIGIEKDQIELLFKPFTQVDTGLTRKHEGTGLGLSICKKLLEMLNGFIEVKSEFGFGSVFTVKLPINKK